MADNTTAKKRPELLAPAGDLEGVRTALRYGADAIYLGGPFMQLRAEKVGFTEETLAEAAELIHSCGAKLNVTVNSFAVNSEIPLLGDYARRLKDLGADALIVSDIGAIAEIKEKCPEIAVHVSTQANTMNYRACEVYWNMGASRVVLARELTLEQIREINEKKPKGLELESFVHGSMCMAYSGRCIMSAYLTGRSANRGGCAQSCRWNYYLMEEKRPGEYFPVFEDEKGFTIMSSKDLCAIAFLDQLEEAGIVSFKIEGRMRTPYSIGTTVNAYRMMLDGRCSLEEARQELETSSHRPFSTGFYFGDPNQVATDSDGYIRDWLFVGSAAEDAKDGYATILTRNAFSVGDEITAVSPGYPGRPFTLTEIFDEEGNSMERSSHPMKLVRINAPEWLREGDLLRRRSDRQ